MKMRFLLIFTAILLTTSLWSQGHKQVQWDFSSRLIDNSTELVLTASIESGWHIYSQFMTGDGPIPTTVEFKFPSGLKADGTIKEPVAIKHYDENFGMDVYYFNEKVEFIQSIKGNIKSGDVIKGKVNFMICNDEMCLPPTDVHFEIKL